MAAGLAFPHAAQAIQIIRRRTSGKKKWSRETADAITSLTATQASPGGLAAIIRGHWMIEDRLHWVGDRDYEEDRSQIRTASDPRGVATSLVDWPSPSCDWPGTPASPLPSATKPAGQIGHHERS